MKKITREKAFNKGLKKFFTGEICTNGHNSERLTKSGVCVACNSEKNARYRAKPVKNPEKRKEYFKEYRKEYYANNKDEIKQKQRDNGPANRAKYRDKINARNRESYADNRIALLLASKQKRDILAASADACLCLFNAYTEAELIECKEELKNAWDIGAELSKGRLT